MTIPPGQPPAIPPEDRDNYILRDEVERFARAVLAQRHGVSQEVIRDLIESHPDVRAEYEALIDEMTQKQRPDWLNQGVRVFEVVDDPDGDVILRGHKHRVVRHYTQFFPPSHRGRTSVHPVWLKSGGMR